MTAPLFDPATGDGPAVQAMAAQIEAWKLAGRAVSLVVRRTLLDQALAIDLAREARRPTAITGASKIMLELLQGFRLLEDAPPPADDPFDRFLAAVQGDDAERAAAG